MKRLEFPDSRLDERDTMFARAARIMGSENYKEFYSRRPHLKKTDDKLRSLPELCSQSTRYYDATISNQALEYFDRIENIKLDQSIIDRYSNKLSHSKNKTRCLKKISKELGAIAVGCTKTYEEFLYSFKGRLDDDYGDAVNLTHPYSLVFLVEMNHSEMKNAPKSRTIRESAKQYFEAARISFYLEAILKSLGFEAKSNYDAHYDMILPPMAIHAGLGEMGRNNILIADKFGSRVRIAAVTTDMKLKEDKPIDLGAEAFCKICKKCADNCPSNSLSQDDKVAVRGVDKWPTHVETCYGYWRTIGTDCGICMAVCPFSHKNNLFHNLVRKLIRYIPAFHHIALYFDDLIYGRKWKASGK